MIVFFIGKQTNNPMASSEQSSTFLHSQTNVWFGSISITGRCALSALGFMRFWLIQETSFTSFIFFGTPTSSYLFSDIASFDVFMTLFSWQSRGYIYIIKFMVDIKIAFNLTYNIYSVFICCLRYSINEYTAFASCSKSARLVWIHYTINDLFYLVHKCY